METIDKYGADIQSLNQFVSQLDPAVRPEAFKFLLSRHFNAENRKQTESNTQLELAQPEQELGQRFDRQLSPQELLRKFGASTIVDKAIAFGYWLEMHQGQKSFSGSDLKRVFETAREPVPANPSDVVAKLEGAGKLMRAEKLGGAQYYRLTRTAIEEIERKAI
jgi:hypothetical protein